MDRNNQMDTEEGLTDSQAPVPALAQLPHAAGGVSLDPEIFIADVINMVNDLTFDGLDSMEKFIARKLDLRNEDSQRALKQGVDNIYDKVQNNIDESFGRWESICRDLYFSKLASNPSIVRISEKTTGDASKTCITASRVEDGQEEALDSELRSLQSQLVAAHKEGAKMRRELTLLEKRLASRRGVLSDVKAAEEVVDSNVHAEIMSSADLLLRDITSKARGSLDKKWPQLHCLAEQSQEESISALKFSSEMEMGDPAVLNLFV